MWGLRGLDLGMYLKMGEAGCRRVAVGCWGSGTVGYYSMDGGICQGVGVIGGDREMKKRQPHCYGEAVF